MSIIETDKKLLSTNKINKNKFNNLNLLISNSEFYYLIVNRWVGIDALMAVSSREDILGKNLFFKSFKEKFHKSKPTFYEMNFKIENKVQKIKSNVKGNTLPGIVAYLYYFGSLNFLFFGIFILCLFASLIEFVAYKMTYQNMIFSGLIGQVIAFRFAHFGYMPAQSYLLFGSIIFTIFLIFFIKFYLIKFSKTKNY